MMKKTFLPVALATLIFSGCGGQDADSTRATDSVIAASPAASMQAPQRMLALTTSNVLSNAGFESSDSSWTASDAVLTVNPFSAHTGSGYAWMGGYNLANDLLYQSVSIPATATSSYLQFWYSITTSESPILGAYDKLAVDVYNASGSAKLGTLATLTNLNKTSGWVQSTQYDLSAYKGQTIRVRFNATTDSTNVTDFLLDDIVVYAPAASSTSPTVDGSVITFSGNRSNYTIAKSTSGYSVTNKSSGVATNVDASIKTIKFDDVSINLEVGTKAASVSAANLNSLLELYIAYFNRVPDADGMSYWLDQLKAGASLSQIGQSFYSAAVQYSSLTGYTANMSNADFVKLIYKNVLGRSTPDADGLNYWSNALADGSQTRGTLVKTMIESAHSFKGNATYGWVADLLDNKVSVATYFAVQQGITYNLPSDSITKGMQIASSVTQTDTATAKALVPTPDPTLNLKPETSTVTCTAPQVLVNGVCTTASETHIRPGFSFLVDYSRAASTYHLQFGYVGTDPRSYDTLGSATVTAEEAAEDPEDLPAALAAASRAVKEFEAIIDRLWTAKTYPPHDTMVAIFRGAVQKALAEEDASVAGPYAASKFTEAGYPAAAGSTTTPTPGSNGNSPCAEPYTGPNVEPQLDSFCQNAYGNSCLDRANGTSLYREQTKVVCRILDGTLKALGDNRSSAQYCSYCNPTNIP
jgi:hypothetical protein